MRCDARRGMARFAAVLGVLALAALTTGCGPSPVSTTAPVPTSGQQLFKVDLIADDSALDGGVLGYQAPATMAAGSDATLVVEVTDVGKGKAGTTPPPAGFVYVNQDVPTGGLVGVQATCQDVACGPESPERQPVLKSGDTGNWSWSLAAQSPGTAHVVLVATTYDQGTSTPLHVTSAIDIPITVTATPGYWVSEAGSWTKGVLGFIGFGAIATGAQWLWRHRRKRKKDAPADPKEPKEPAEPAEPTAH